MGTRSSVLKKAFGGEELFKFVSELKSSASSISAIDENL